MSLDSSGFVRFTRVGPVGRWVHTWSLGSLGFSLVVVGLIRYHWVNSGAPRGSVGSSGVVRFVLVRTWGLCVHPSSLGSFGCALGVVGIIRGRWVHSGALWRS